MKHTWVVTGANRGIGLELVRRLTSRGEEVVATARRPTGAKELIGTGAKVLELNVLDDESVAAFSRTIGEMSVDVLVNNAGAMERAGDLGAVDTDAMVRQFETNALGPLRVTQALLPMLRRGKRKLVAQMSSKMGSIEDNTSGGSYAYRTSKTALNMINRSMSVDLADEGFTCLCLHPGWVRTDMGGDDARLSVEESAEGLLKILDGADSSSNGRFFAYDGEELPW